MKTKIKYHGDEVTNLNDKEIPKVETPNYFGFYTQERCIYYQQEFLK